MIPVSLNPNVSNLKPSATLLMNEMCREMEQEGKEVLKLGFGQSPFPVPRPVVKALAENAHQKDYLPVNGLLELRLAVADYWNRTQKVSYSHEDVMISPGSKELLFLVQMAFYGELIIPSPSWVSYSPQAIIAGKDVRWIETFKENDWILQAGQLEDFCSKQVNRPRTLVINYPSNPTGATYSLDQLNELAAVARKYQLIVISDEIYGDLHHTGDHLSIAQFYPEGTIISSGLSKWCGAGGWRLGTFIFPPQLRWLHKAVSAIASETYTTTSAPIQYASIAAFGIDEEITAQVRESQRILKAIGGYLHEVLAELTVHTPKPQGGFYLFPDFSVYRNSFLKRGIQTSREMCNSLLSEAGIALLPSFDFGCPSDQLTARLSYVDFNGQQALRLAQTKYSGQELNQDFIMECAPKIPLAAFRLAKWLTKS